MPNLTPLRSILFGAAALVMPSRAEALQNLEIPEKLSPKVANEVDSVRSLEEHGFERIGMSNFWRHPLGFIAEVEGNKGRFYCDLEIKDPQSISRLYFDEGTFAGLRAGRCRADGSIEFSSIDTLSGRETPVNDAVLEEIKIRENEEEQGLDIAQQLLSRGRQQSSFEVLYQDSEIMVSRWQVAGLFLGPCYYLAVTKNGELSQFAHGKTVAINEFKVAEMPPSPSDLRHYLYISRDQFTWKFSLYDGASTPELVDVGKECEPSEFGEALLFHTDPLDCALDYILLLGRNRLVNGTFVYNDHRFHMTFSTYDLGSYAKINLTNLHTGQNIPFTLGLRGDRMIGAELSNAILVLLEFKPNPAIPDTDPVVSILRNRRAADKGAAVKLVSEDDVDRLIRATVLGREELNNAEYTFIPDRPDTIYQLATKTSEYHDWRAAYAALLSNMALSELKPGVVPWEIYLSGRQQLRSIIPDQLAKIESSVSNLYIDVEGAFEFRKLLEILNSEDPAVLRKLIFSWQCISRCASVLIDHLERCPVQERERVITQLNELVPGFVPALDEFGRNFGEDYRSLEISDKLSSVRRINAEMYVDTELLDRLGIDILSRNVISELCLVFAAFANDSLSHKDRAFLANNGIRAELFEAAWHHVTSSYTQFTRARQCSQAVISLFNGSAEAEIPLIDILRSIAPGVSPEVRELAIKLIRRSTHERADRKIERNQWSSFLSTLTGSSSSTDLLRWYLSQSRPKFKEFIEKGPLTLQCREVAALGGTDFCMILDHENIRSLGFNFQDNESITLTCGQAHYSLTYTARPSDPYFSLRPLSDKTGGEITFLKVGTEFIATH